MGVKWAHRRPQVYQLLLGNLSTSYHGHQPEVFLQHDSRCACQDVLELLTAVMDFKTRVFRLKPEVQILGSSKSIRHTKVEILSLKSCFLRNKETNLTQIFEKHFQLNYSVGVGDVFMLFCLIICIWHANRVPDPVLRGQPYRSRIKNVWCLSSLLSRVIDVKYGCSTFTFTF